MRRRHEDMRRGHEDMRERERVRERVRERQREDMRRGHEGHEGEDIRGHEDMRESHRESHKESQRGTEREEEKDRVIQGCSMDDIGRDGAVQGFGTWRKDQKAPCHTPMPCVAGSNPSTDPGPLHARATPLPLGPIPSTI